MSKEPYDSQDFDFGPEQTFGVEAIAETVLWPLVDSLWRGNWRADAGNDFKFDYPKRAKLSGKMLDVLLEAECELWSDNNEQPKSMHEVCLYVEEETQGMGQQIALQSCKIAANELSGSLTGDEDEVPPWVWPEGEDDELLVKNGMLYSLDTDGGFLSEQYRVIEGPEQRMNIPVPTNEESPTSGEKLHIFDIEVIEAACIVLGAHKSIKLALQEIKAHPIFLN